MNTTEADQSALHGDASCVHACRAKLFEYSQLIDSLLLAHLEHALHSGHWVLLDLRKGRSRSAGRQSLMLESLPTQACKAAGTLLKTATEMVSQAEFACFTKGVRTAGAPDEG